MDSLLQSNDVQLYTIANDNIVIHQSDPTNTCSEGLCCCKQLPSDMVRWNYVAPTPALEQRGLTPTVLRNELNVIQNKFADAVKLSPKQIRYTSIAAIIGLLTLVIGNFGLWISLTECAGYCDSYYEDSCCSVNYGWLVPATAGLVILSICAFLNRRAKAKVFNEALDAIREYVEIDLNEKYQKTTGIRWSILEEKLITVTQSNQGTTTTTLRYCHIGINCVAVINNTVIVVNNNEHNIQSQQVSQASEGDQQLGTK